MPLDDFPLFYMKVRRIKKNYSHTFTIEFRSNKCHFDSVHSWAAFLNNLLVAVGSFHIRTWNSQSNFDFEYKAVTHTHTTHTHNSMAALSIKSNSSVRMSIILRLWFLLSKHTSPATWVGMWLCVCVCEREVERFIVPYDGLVFRYELFRLAFSYHKTPTEDW